MDGATCLARRLRRSCMDARIYSIGFHADIVESSVHAIHHSKVEPTPTHKGAVDQWEPKDGSRPFVHRTPRNQWCHDLPDGSRVTIKSSIIGKPTDRERTTV